MRHRLLALDLDGTLLAEGGHLDEEGRRAVARIRRAGVRVVLCTGRRFRTAEPIARELGLDGPIVVHNGVVVKDIASGNTLHQDYLAWKECELLVPRLQEIGAPMVYVDDWPNTSDILIDRRHRPHEFQRDYLSDNEAYTKRVDDLSTSAPEQIVMMSLIGHDSALRQVRDETRPFLGNRLRTNLIDNSNYRGHILEFLSARSSKWTGLLHVATRLGIPPEEIAAVGDDTNDIEMIEGADLGIAMGNAPLEVQASADRVVAPNAQGGLSEAIQTLLDAS
jgi:Cof subfamily protein (haloacid dehalogenase superfamily)